MIYKILYIAFVISSLLFGNFHLGPFTLKIYTAIAVLCYCIKKNALFVDKSTFLLFLFSAFFMYSGISNGYTSNSLTYFFSYYFICYVSYVSTYLYMKKYGTFDMVFKSLIFLGIIDSVVTLAQFLGQSWSFVLSDLFTDKSQSERLNNYYDNYGSLMGKALPGLFTAVQNGYYLSSMCILSLWTKLHHLNYKSLLLWMVFVGASYCVQERTGFVVGVSLSLLLFFIIIKESKSKHLYFLFTIVICIVLMLNFDLLSSNFLSDDSRYSDMTFSNNSRWILYHEAMYFIYQHLDGGSIFLYMDTHTDAPHNLFLNAFVYGGLFGTLVIFTLLIIQSKIIIYVFRKISFIRNPNLYFAIFIYIAYTFNSITHNFSIVSGGSIYWVLWAVILYEYNKFNRSRQLGGL